METNELLVKRQIKLKYCIPSFIFIIAMIVFILFAVPLISGMAAMKIAVLIILSYLALHFFKDAMLEYDYCFTQGELSVDKVYNKTRRVNYHRFDIKGAEIAAPLGSKRLPTNINNVIDVSSGNIDDYRYAIVLTHNNRNTMLIVQAEEKLIEAIYRTIPSKFFRD